MSTARATRRPHVLELRVVFDTSVIFNSSEGDLMRLDATQAIRENSQHPDVRIVWYLPDVVRYERQFQMEKRALALLPSLEKLERLLGHQLNITQPIITQRVNEAVESQIKDLGFAILELNQAKVDLKRIMLDACYRRPPFEPGEKEKGFRDALIAEAFVQLIECSPRSTSTCRVILVAADNPLADAVRVRVSGASNVRILSSIEELKGLISTLVEKVTEEFVAAHQEKARTYFWKKDGEQHLWDRLRIRETIKERFDIELRDIPEGASTRENGTLAHIGAPRFVRKERQRVFWATRITIKAEAYAYKEEIVADPHLTEPVRDLGYTPLIDIDYTTQPLLRGIESPILAGYDWVTPPAVSPGLPQYALPVSGIYAFASPSTTRTRKELVAKGQSVFEVAWSAIVKTNGNFSSPNLESIVHVETTWD